MSRFYWGFKKTKREYSDKYTYFLTSECSDKFVIEKMHACTWLYEDGTECVELGLQIKLNDGVDVCKELSKMGSDPFLPITFWAKWINQRDGNRVIDLYPTVSEMRNARFIFNDDCVSVSRCDSWSTERGFRLKFASGKELCALPASPVVGDGRIDFKIVFPAKFVNTDSLYIRICSRVPSGTIAFHAGANSKKIYAYNININQMRNAPSSSEFRVNERCILNSLYVIHIFPSCYTQTFTDGSFHGIRMLEADRYNEYVKGADVFKSHVDQDEQEVSFNKIAPKTVDRSTEYTYFALFEKDIIGWKQWLFALGGVLFGAALGVLPTVIPGCRDKGNEGVIAQSGNYVDNDNVQKAIVEPVLQEELNEGPSSH